MKTPDQGALRAVVTKRPWWRLRYTDGRIVNEWDGPDWSLAPHKGRQAVRLCCPNGQIAELGSDGDCSGRLFQFKVATIMAGVDRQTIAYLIGMVDGPNGECKYAAWIGEQIVTGRDNINMMRFQNVGPLSQDVLGLKV